MGFFEDAKNIVSNLKTTNNNLLNLIKGLKWAHNSEVLVGIPAETNASHGGITNAELLYIHSQGSPARGIPARPTIETGIAEEGTQQQIQKFLKTGLTMANMGNIMGAEKQYQKAGMVGMNAAKAQFGKIGPPLKPATIARKGSSATLIDTGQLRNAITFVVRKK